uniref:Uncharacterized protein n=1 Tax=Romanomermis culicivorax TaxID=13658 RepID=A0A915JEZ7_ROMCU
MISEGRHAKSRARLLFSSFALLFDSISLLSFSSEDFFTPFSIILCEYSGLNDSKKPQSSVKCGRSQK